MVVLGLDISTITVGYAFIKNQDILIIGFIDISKEKSIKDKAVFAYEHLQDIKYFDDVDEICVEDSLLNFARGRTSTQTIVKLAKFNAVLCFILEWGSDIKVNLINPSTARKVVFGKSREKGKPAKEFVKEQVEKRYNTKKWIKINTRGNFERRNIDSYDALTVALYYLNKLDNNELKRA